jgi:hypothetical protein
MNKRTTLLLITGLIVSLYVTGQSNPDAGTQFTIYGFGRTNFIWDNRDLGRTDLFVPANIKINAPKNPNYFIGAKQTRIGFDIKQPVGNDFLFINVEGDFHNDASDANGIFRMRQAYAQYKFLIVGMTWSNFFDDGVNPVSIDFEGPNSSTLSRSPQVRFSTYKSKNILSLSFENPVAKITTYDSVSILPQRFPDMIGAYKIVGDLGSVKVAALLRELRYESDQARSVLGYGLTVMTVINAGHTDKLKFQGVMGTGVAQYIKGASGLNYDAIYNGTDVLDALQMRGANISYQHFWSSDLHSSLTAGFLNVEDNTNLKASDYKSGYYASVNLFWNAIKNLAFGAEALAGRRVNIDGDNGSAIRLQMNATYKFSKSIK